MADVYNIYCAVWKRAWEVQRVAEVSRSLLAYRTFKDAIISTERFSVVTETPMPDGRRGACICSKRSLRYILSVGLKHRGGPSSDIEQSVTPNDICDELRTLAGVYRGLNLTKDTTDLPSFELCEEIKTIPTRLWVFWFGCLSSRRLQRERNRLLREHNGDILRLPFPHSNNCDLDTSMLRALPHRDYRRVIRAVVSIQSAVFTMDSRAVGPMLWCFSCTLSSKGDIVLRLGNAAGFSIHPNTLNHLKKGVMAQRKAKPLSKLLRSNTLSAFAFHNLDAEMAVNVVADGSRPTQFHGTAFIAEQTPGLPITSRGMYTSLPESVGHPADPLKLSGVQEKILRESKAFLLGVIACFGEQLLSTKDEVATTIGFLVRNLLQGLTRQHGAIIENLSFFNAPSNNSATVRTDLDCIEQAACLRELPKGTCANLPYVTATADEPLYERMIQIMYGGGPPESRNPEFEHIIPLPGGLSIFDMGLCHVGKRLCFHSFMSGIVPFSGLPDGAARRFFERKDPKTTHRVFEQVAAAAVRRIIDSLLESSHLSQHDLPAFERGRYDHSCTEVLSDLMRSQERGESVSPTNLRMKPGFPGEEIIMIGQQILDAAERRAGELDEHQFSYFGLDLVINMLLPCMMVRYLGRAGQAKQRHALVKSLGNALYVSAKVKYHRVMLHYLCEFERMPKDVRDRLMNAEYSTTNLTGSNLHGNQDVDEVMEETGIKRTKEGAYVRTERALRLSFPSTGLLDYGHKWLLQVLWRNSFYRERQISNFEKRLANGASRMYVHLCRGSGATIWLGHEHQAMPTVSNVSVIPHINLTAGQQLKLENCKSIARENIQFVSLRAVPEFIQRASQVELKVAWKGKLDRLEFFRDEYKKRCKNENRVEKAATVKQKRSAVVSSIWKNRAAEMKEIGQCSAIHLQYYSTLIADHSALARYTTVLTANGHVYYMCRSVGE